MDSKRGEWIEALERALGPLVNSASGNRNHPPPLDNGEYRALGAAAKHDAGSRAEFDQYVIRLNDDPAELVEVLSLHPAIEPNAAEDGDLAVFVSLPSKGFRLELRHLARHLTRCAVVRGTREAAAHLERFLDLTAEGRVPGYDITGHQGLTMDGELEIAPGLEIVSYERASDRGPGGTGSRPRSRRFETHRHGSGAASSLSSTAATNGVSVTAYMEPFHVRLNGGADPRITDGEGLPARQQFVREWRGAAACVDPGRR